MLLLELPALLKSSFHHPSSLQLLFQLMHLSVPLLQSVSQLPYNPLVSLIHKIVVLLLLSSFSSKQVFILRYDLILELYLSL